MRCGTPVTVYAFTTSSGSTRTALSTVNLSAEGATCTASQYVVMTDAEFALHTASPFRLTVAEGGAVAGGILLLWAAAWGVRALARVLSHTDTPPSHE
jgi:hypothetical protein